MIRKIFLLIGLASPLMAQQLTPTAVSTPASTAGPQSASAPQTSTPDPVQSELDAQKLKLRMPVGVSSTSFDLSDSARRSMISSPSVLRFSDQIQLTRQDSITMRGLMDLPIASLSEVVSKMDFFTQIRLVRFGLLQINSKPQDARLYASKLYILTDEIFPRKALQDSLMIEMALANERSKVQQASATTPAVASIKNQPANSGSSWLPSLVLLMVAGAGGYYWFVIRKKSPKPDAEFKDVSGDDLDAADDPAIQPQVADQTTYKDDILSIAKKYAEFPNDTDNQLQEDDKPTELTTK